VCTQALFNVIGAERYGQVPDQVIRYVMGRFGRPTRPVEPEVEARILDRPRAREIAAEPPCLALDDLRRRLPRGLSDEEFLLRSVMPAEQVDAMLAAGPAKRSYSPVVSRVSRLLEQAGGRPAESTRTGSTSGLKVTLKSSRAATAARA
jgi:oxaloacetate decarboxylase alpha subunit